MFMKPRLTAEQFQRGPVSNPSNTSGGLLGSISPADLGTNWLAGGPHAPLGPNNPAHFADIGGSPFAGTNIETMGGGQPQMMPFPVAPFPGVQPGMTDFNQMAFNLGTPQGAPVRNVNFAQPNMTGVNPQSAGGGGSGDSNARRLFFDPFDIMSNDTERVLFDPFGLFG